jgi:hypothetical protein
MRDVVCSAGACGVRRRPARGPRGPRLAHDVPDLAGRHAAPAGAHALQDAADLRALQVAVAADVRLRARASVHSNTAARLHAAALRVALPPAPPTALHGRQLCSGAPRGAAGAVASIRDSTQNGRGRRQISQQAARLGA